MDRDNKIKKWLFNFSICVAVIVVYKFLDNFNEIGNFISNLISVLMPFIVGILLAYILYIPCKKIEELLNKKRKFKRKSRGLAIFIVYIILFIFIFLLFKVIIPPVIQSIIDLVNNLPNYYNNLNKIIGNIPSDLEILNIKVSDVLSKIINVDLHKYFSVESITSYIKGIIGIASSVFNIFITIIISIYTLCERASILNFMKKIVAGMFSKETYTQISNNFKRTNIVFFNFVSGQVIDAIIVGILTTIALLIMKVKYAVLFGFFIGLFNLIPFFGAIIAVAITIVITMCTGGIWKGICVGIVITILQQIDANIINPKIIGDRLKISPILNIISVTLFGEYFGILGMFLAVPTVAMLKLIINDYLDLKIIQKTKHNTTIC